MWKCFTINVNYGGYIGCDDEITMDLEYEEGMTDEEIIEANREDIEQEIVCNCSITICHDDDEDDDYEEED